MLHASIDGSAINSQNKNYRAGTKVLLMIG